MTVDRLLARARAEVLAVARDVLTLGPTFAVLVSLDVEGAHHVGVFTVASIVGMMRLDVDRARAVVAQESTPLPVGQFRVVVNAGSAPVVVVFALESGAALVTAA